MIYVEAPEWAREPMFWGQLLFGFLMVVVVGWILLNDRRPRR